MSNEDQIESDGITVWVHDRTDGSCIGRFGRMGIDIHRPILQQAEFGQCLLCTHGPTGAAEWRQFVEAMKRIFEIEISEHHRPRHINAD